MFNFEPDITKIRTRVHAQVDELLSTDYFSNIAKIDKILRDHAHGRNIVHIANKAAIEALIFTEEDWNDIGRRFGFGIDPMCILYQLNFEFNKLLGGN